jgi:cytochrome c-type biogenesis protein CcmH
MGWIALAVIGFAAFGLMWALGVPRSLVSFTGAALMFGAAGYALQQNATLPGYPVQANARTIDVDPGLVAFRGAIMPAAAGNAAILAADSQLRAGSSEAAAQGLLGAVRREPDNAALWTALGSVLVAHDGGQISPAAQSAFRRAIDLAPDQPGPPFFFGMAYVQAGDLAVARQAWLVALRVAPRDAPYRADIARRLVLIDQLLAMRAGSVHPAPDAPRR